ncbi:MAG: hypothetical protein HZA93_22135 [Verrucomicrobia bacterium]|nr:hypothetical protein [Verrucomicrobiota bacterium]
MKSSLKSLSLTLAISVPGSLFAQLGGAQLPAVATPSFLFIAFVTALTILTVVSDYTHTPRPPRLPQPRGTAHAEIRHLRATSASFRLAA